MKMRFLTTIACALFTLLAVAQENGLNPIYQLTYEDMQYQPPKKKSTAVAVMSAIADVAVGRISDTQHEVYVPMVNAQVKSAFTKVRRLMLVDQPASTADIHITGLINQLQTVTETRTNEYKDSKGKVIKEKKLIYHANVAITLNFTWADGVVQSQNFSTTAYESIGMTSAEKALQSAIAILCNKIIKHYNKEYALAANIIERGADKKDKQKEVYIDLGALNGLTPDMHFLVYEVGEVAGRETRKEVGKLRVEEVLGDDISLCKVQKGGKDIKAALDAGKRVMAFSID